MNHMTYIHTFLLVIGMSGICVQAQPPYEGEVSEAKIYGLSYEDRMRYAELCPELASMLAQSGQWDARTFELIMVRIHQVQCCYKAMQYQANKRDIR